MDKGIIVGKHKLTNKRFLVHKIKHRYFKLGQAPAQIARNLRAEPGFVDRVCEHAFFLKYLK